MRYDFGRRWLCGVGLSAAALGLVAGGPAAMAQDPTPTAAVAGVYQPPVALHDGTCANPQLAPEADLGDMNPVPLVVDVDVEILDGDDDYDGVVDADEEGYLSEDLNADGILDEGEDLDGDGILDAGFDADGDGALDPEEVVVAVPLPQAVTVFKEEAEIDLEFDELFGQPHAIAVHKNDAEYGTLIACGDLVAPEEDPEGEVLVPLRPVNGSGYYGYAVLQEDTGDAPAIPVFGDDTTGVTVYLFEGLTTQRDERMAAATPAAPATTPTPAATATLAAFDLPTEFTLELGNTDFNPSEFRIAADTDVELTLANLSTTEANFTIDELGIAETLAPGETRSITVNAPAGTYRYYSTVPAQLEAGMEGTLIVGQ